MAKKKNNELKIDFKKCIIEDCLLQIKKKAFRDDLDLVEAWTIDISPKSTSTVLPFIKCTADKDPVVLSHLKRISKISPDVLRVLICSTQLFNERELRDELSKSSVNYCNISLQKVPAEVPSTRDLSREWSEKYWPLVWKGNPNDQILNEVAIDIDFTKEILTSIAEKAFACISEGTLPIVSIIVDPDTNQIMASSSDERHLHPLHHSIMRCVNIVSEKEQQRRNELRIEQGNYLCFGYHVFTTHEPCSMCSMALVHSRVSRLVYIQQSALTGALNPTSSLHYCINNHRLLNSSFEVWEYVGDPISLPKLSNEVNA